MCFTVNKFCKLFAINVRISYVFFSYAHADLIAQLEVSTLSNGEKLQKYFLIVQGFFITESISGGLRWLFMTLFQITSNQKQGR